MEGKPVSLSRNMLAVVMNPEDANPMGNVHGGVIMKLVDTVAGVVAIRHAGRMAVTASIDRLDFLSPVYVGDLVILRASMNLVGKTSMEVGVRVECQNVITGVSRHTSTAYLTFVALDKDGKPSPVPPLILENVEDRRRCHEAGLRRTCRLDERAKEE
jgi:uncharacterized protein (TIGR00369 family)